MITTVRAQVRQAMRNPWTGYGLAVLSVCGAVGVTLAFEPVGDIHYLPFVGAVFLTALVAPRGGVILAITLSIVANMWLVQGQGVTDMVLNAVLFIVAGLAIRELARRRRELLNGASELRLQLDSRNAMLNAVLVSVPVVTVDGDGSISLISEPARRLFGLSEREARGRPFRDLIDTFDIVSAAEGNPDSTRDTYSIGRHFDGTTFPVDIQIGVVPASDGPDHLILCLTDLNPWHASEARNQELATQLGHVWRMNSLGEIAAILSHELNQPLTAAASYLQASQADLVRVGILAESAIRTIDLAKSQVLRAGTIIRRARDLLSMDGGELQPERVSSMIEDLNPIIALLGPAAGAQIQIDLDGNSDADAVLADRIQFQQAIVNLVRNAVEAVDGRDRREVAIIGRPISDGFYGISVEDSGPGIAPQDVSRMFQPLMTTKSDGMGLGLSVTRTIVERHGGTLAVRGSALGGAAFDFALVRDPQTAAAP